MSNKAKSKFYPVLENQDELKIPWETLKTIIGGTSIIDTKQLHTSNLRRALVFLRAYGINPDNPDDVAASQTILQVALQYMDEVFLKQGVDEASQFPKELRERPIHMLLQDAANWKGTGTNWACLLLKICHATSHAVWSHDSEAHSKAIEVISERLKPHLHTKHGSEWIGDEKCMIPLISFVVKKEKHLFRVITKLLLKSGNLSTAIRDHVGLRFIVEDTFSAILLIKYMRTRGIFMYANNIPEESKNSLAGLDEIQSLYEKLGPPDYEDKTRTKNSKKKSSKSSSNQNPYSSAQYGMIKLIERLLITLPNGRRTFFPYELQILTRKEWEKLDKGDARHDEYEERQVAAVRKRLLS